MNNFHAGFSVIHRIHRGIFLAPILVLLSACGTGTSEHADKVFLDAAIYTLDQNNPWAQALAIKDGKILFVGDNDSVQPYIGDSTQVVELEGAFIMPGINDLHIHAVSGGYKELYECNFPFSSSIEAIQQAVAQCAQRDGAGEWITGGQWGSEIIHGHQGKPIRELLDEVSGDKAVILSDDTLHNSIANSKALALAGIGKDTPDPTGGAIRKDPQSGEPTGLLLESAGGIVRGKIPPRGPDDNLRAAQKAVSILNAYGITGWKSAGANADILEAYHRLDVSGELTGHVAASLALWGYGALNPEQRDAMKEKILAAGKQFSSQHLHTQFVKFGLDGVPPSKTAYMIQAYLDDSEHPPGWHGEPTMTQDLLNREMIALDKLGYTVKVHAAGDGSVRMVLDAIEAARDANGDSGLRHEVSHASFIDPSDIPRFKQLNAAAELAPVLWHPTGILVATIEAMGERGNRFWPNKDLLDSGAFLVGGSDWPAAVPTANPWVGIEALVTRKHPLGEMPGSLWPEQSIDLASAIAIYTINGAEAMQLEDLTGSIEAGKSADLVILDKNLFEIDPDRIAETRVLQTLFEGRTVFSAGQ